MIDKNVAIAALARNCAENLPGNIIRIEELRACFFKSKVFIYENNSIDDTKRILRDWQGMSTGVYVKSEDIDESKYHSSIRINRLYCGTNEVRIKKMCDCRNKLLDLIWSQGGFDYVIFVDIDIEWFSVKGIISAIMNAPEGWGALFSNCYSTVSHKSDIKIAPYYYDTFAFLDCNRSPELIKKKELNKVKRHFLSRRLFKAVSFSDYYKCNSAFGGIGIYRCRNINEIRYCIYKPDSWANSNLCLCEHILYNYHVDGFKYIAKGIEVKYSNTELSSINWLLYKMSPLAYGVGALIKGLFVR